MLERIVVDGGDAQQVDTEVQAIRGVEMAAVQRLAAGVIEPARMIAAVRGDRRAVAAALDALGVAKGTIEWIEDKKAGGQPVRPAETPKVAGLKN